MKRMRVALIREGDCYEQSVFLPMGQKAIPAQTTITSRHIQMLLRQSSPEVFLADSVDELEAADLLDSWHSSPPGPQPTHGNDQPVSVESGNTPLPQMPPASTPGNNAERARFRKERMAVADEVVEQLHRRSGKLSLRVRPEEREIWDGHQPADDSWPDAATLQSIRERHVEALRDLHVAIESGHDISAESFERIVDAMWPMLLNHRERFTQLALLVSRRDDYLPDHTMCVAVLAMATAAQLTWSEADVRLAGMAALACDLGMLLIPQRIRIGGEQLTDIDRGRVQRHAVYSVAMLDKVRDLPDIVRLAAWQHHERDNGSGYPLALRGDAICDLARIVAVADVFAALTSPRHYRRNRLPYVAMEQMVRSSAAGQFYKPATRALVQAAGLFPVGSYVKLTDGRMAHILAANANHLDRPIIQPLDDNGQPVGSWLDLSRMPTKALAVTRPVAGPVQATQPA